MELTILCKGVHDEVAMEIWRKVVSEDINGRYAMANDNLPEYLVRG